MSPGLLINGPGAVFVSCAIRRGIAFRYRIAQWREVLSDNRTVARPGPAVFKDRDQVVSLIGPPGHALSMRTGRPILPVQAR